MDRGKSDERDEGSAEKGEEQREEEICQHPAQGVNAEGNQSKNTELINGLRADERLEEEATQKGKEAK